MALHSDLPIHRTGVQLLTLAVQAQAQMPRGVKRHLGDKLQHHCMEMADRIGVARRWIQHAGTPLEHFDICLSKRALAVQAGAREIDVRETAAIVRRKREEAARELQSQAD
jgi:hypothetical protein